ncbi:MAG: DUF481 domain-containing protein [Acidobacteriia bacterium]|nr:DUF481 domain-containing protein [Terriglobia bacterium]
MRSLSTIRNRFLTLLAVAGAVCLSTAAAAQTPAPPPDPPTDWTGSIGAGLSLTQGNNNTVNFSAAFDSVYDPKHGNVAKFTALFLRGKKDGELVVDRTSFGARDERTMSPRTFAFGQVDFLKDTFKQIDSLVSPNAGFGYKVVDSEATKFLVDAGAGAAWEKNPGIDTKVYGAITLDEKLTRQLTPTTTLKHAVSSLLKGNEPADGLYTVSLGLGVKINARMQLSIDLLDSFKNRPPDAAKRNDVALITSIAAKY